MSVSPDQSICRADVLWRNTLDGVLVRPVGATEVVMLAGTGATLWGALDVPLAFADLCSALAESHNTDPATIARDLSPVIVDLTHRGVLT